MQKKVSIHVSGKQKYPEGHTNQQELITTGTFYERNGVSYVVYKESEKTGLEGVTTYLSIKEETIGLNRKGAADLNQVFKKGVLNRSIYTTSCGDLWVSVLPHLVEYDLTANGGRINLEYDLFIDDNLVSYNVLLLNIKEDLPQ